jgi:hypothetical protein
MTCLTLTVRESVDGWFVFWPVRIGPFISKDHAVDVAQGLALAMMAAGQEAEVVVATSLPEK